MTQEMKLFFFLLKYSWFIMLWSICFEIVLWWCLCQLFWEGQYSVYTDALNSEEGVVGRSVWVPERGPMGSQGNWVIEECWLPAGRRVCMQKEPLRWASGNDTNFYMNSGPSSLLTKNNATLNDLQTECPGPVPRVSFPPHSCLLGNSR